MNSNINCARLNAYDCRQDDSSIENKLFLPNNSPEIFICIQNQIIEEHSKDDKIQTQLPKIIILFSLILLKIIKIVAED